MMTKKHYEAIAQILNSHEDKSVIVMSLADYFQKDNPDFNIEIFCSKCFEKIEVN